MQHWLHLILILLVFTFFGSLDEVQGRSPASVIKERKQLKANKKKERRQYLVLELVKSTRSRFHAISALTKSMTKEERQSFKNLASSRRIDLRSPVKVSVFKDLSFTVGKNPHKFKWISKEKVYLYKNRKLSFDRKKSAKENFISLQKALGKSSASWLDFLLPKAYAQSPDLNEVVFDLNYLLYLRSLDNEEQIINELGSDYVFKAEEKMVRLVQNNRFLRMECNFGAHSMEARIILGDGSPENQTVLIAGDYGQGRIEHSIERNGTVEKLTSLSENATDLLDRGIFREVCENMTTPELEQYSGDLYYFGGGEGSSQ